MKLGVKCSHQKHGDELCHDYNNRVGNDDCYDDKDEDAGDCGGGVLGYWPGRALRCRERGSPLLLSRSINVDHCKVMGDLLHVLKVEQSVEA